MINSFTQQITRTEKHGNKCGLAFMFMLLLVTKKRHHKSEVLMYEKGEITFCQQVTGL